ncbi:MAG TPA: branched-chain amino acid ABC transporter substrate-binding protein, partial [Actinomycetota bacterium]|nr:branched-chain amino acid ABC transporter substrate-binding protein [Actinomycetota bacterium]
LAVRQANERQAVKGWKIAVSSDDDLANPDSGANVATMLSDNRSVAAVVGPLNSMVAERVAPILNGRKVVMVSPANTDPELTRRPAPGGPARPYDYYFRVAPTDLYQGPFAANYAYRSAGKRTAVVVHDKTPYGQGVALGFKAQFEKLGGRVPAVEAVAPDDGDFSAVLTRVRRLNPDLVYFGGEYPAAARLSVQADQQGVKAPLMGAYGIFDPLYLSQAKDTAVGDLATSVDTPTDELPTARPFLAAYDAAGYNDPSAVEGGYAYDAANVVIAALARVLPGRSGITDEVRAALRQAVQDGTVDGVTGPVAFDRYGDPTVRSLTVYEVERDVSGKPAWMPRRTSQIHGSTWE